MALTIAQAVKKLLVKEPFYGLFLLSLNKFFSDSIDTACVSRNGINVELQINEKFWNSLSDLEEISVLEHEVSHILHGHLTNNWSDFKNENHLNIAQDAEINCYIKNLPEGCVLPSNFGLDPEKGTRYYYDHIPESEDNKYFSILLENQHSLRFLLFELTPI